jgi:hypothetical protein
LKRLCPSSKKTWALNLPPLQVACIHGTSISFAPQRGDILALEHFKLVSPLARRGEEGRKGGRSKDKAENFYKFQNFLRGVVRGVPFRGKAWKNVSKTLRGAVLCNTMRQ